MMSGRSDNGKVQGRGRSNSLPSHVVDHLKAWLMSPDHINHPYPTEKEKAEMVLETGIDLKRLNNWFVNNRIRFWKPRMEALQRKKRLGNQQTLSIITETPPKTLTVESSSAMPSFSPTSSVQQPLEKQTPAISSSSSSDHFVSDISSTANESDDGNVSDANSEIITISADVQQVHHQDHPSLMIQDNTVNLKRKYEETNDLYQSPRSKYSRKNIHLWRNVCMTSPRLNDDNLPSLDEAACLFGYSSDQ